MHIIELNLFPWWRLIAKLPGNILHGSMTYIGIKFALKMIWILSTTLIISKNKPLRKLFGLNN